jgi:hypothetical protein
MFDIVDWQDRCWKAIESIPQDFEPFYAEYCRQQRACGAIDVDTILRDIKDLTEALEVRGRQFTNLYDRIKTFERMEKELGRK